MTADFVLRVSGLDVPASTDFDYLYGQQRRKVFAAFYWENQS